MVGAGPRPGPLYSAFAPAPGRRRREHRRPPPRRPARRSTRRSCITCHGANLQGVPHRGPSLIGVGEAAVYFQVHTGRMPLVRQEAAGRTRSRRSSPTTQIDQLMAYVQANGGGPTLPAGDLRDGDLAQGGELFRLNCASCHNFVGEGGALSSGQGRAEPAERRRQDDLHGHADRPGEHAGVRRQPAHPGPEARRSSTTSRPSRRRPTRAAPASAASARSARAWSSGSSASAPCCSGSSGWGARRDARHDTPRPAPTGGADTRRAHASTAARTRTTRPEQLAAMSREELDRLGARYDGVEILHVDPGPAPGSAAGAARRPPGRPGLRAGRRSSRSPSSSSTSGRAGSCPTGTGPITEHGWSALFTPLLGLLHGPGDGPASASAWCCSPRSCCRTRPRCRTSTTARTSTG